MDNAMAILCGTILWRQRLIPTRRLAAQWPALLSYIPDFLIKMARLGPDPYDK